MNNITQLQSMLSPLCYMPDGKLVCYKRGSIIVLDGIVEIRRFKLFNTFKERYLSRSKLLYRFLRLGVRTAISIDTNNVILSIGNMLYELNIITGNLSNGYYCGKGIRPLAFTKLSGIRGFKDSIYFGGYLTNTDKKPVNIYRRVDKDFWEIVYTFPQGAINHIHNIVTDTYRQCLWILTGDFDESAAIWKAVDGFGSVMKVAGNDQKYRGCVCFAAPEGLIYATDAPFADDFIYFMNPITFEVKELYPIHGSCIYGCKWKEKYVFSSTVEGDGRNLKFFEFLLSRKRGGGIKDDYVHLYSGSLSEGFNEIYKEKKDILPLYTFQFGVFKFPCGTNESDTLCFQPVATNNNDLNLMAYKEEA
jgi:hypothetical protein